MTFGEKLDQAARRLAIATLGAFALLLGLNLAAGGAFAASRIKDIASIEGVRENQLIGYGLVVGLDGTGDTLRNAPFTRQSLEAMLERLGINTRNTNMRTDNVAAVMVTADLPPFSRQGSRIDVTVGALGDAENLQGGTLLVTPLMGADGEVYAVAQGNIAVGGFKAQGQGGSVTKGVPTAGRIANGAIVEREINFQLAALPQLQLALRNPDITTAQRIALVINEHIGSPVAMALDPGTVQLTPLPAQRADIMGFLTGIEQLTVEPDQLARVVIDEVSGTIVMGANVRVSTVAIAQGNLTIRVTETPQVSQPQALSNTGKTTVVPRTDINVDENKSAKLAMVEEGVRLQDLVDGLNALGIGPRDMISILQALKVAGALQADIQVL